MVAYQDPPATWKGKQLLQAEHWGRSGRVTTMIPEGSQKEDDCHPAILGPSGKWEEDSGGDNSSTH